MSHLSIKDVPEGLAAQLRERAARNHRSLQGELLAIIERAVNESPSAASLAATHPSPTWAAPARRSPAMAVDRSAGRRGSKTIEQIAVEHRGRFPQSIQAGLLAVDVLRADRDAR